MADPARLNEEACLKLIAGMREESDRYKEWLRGLEQDGIAERDSDSGRAFVIWLLLGLAAVSGLAWWL